MKNIIRVLFVCILCAVIFSFAAFAQKPIEVYLDNQKVEFGGVEPQIVSGRTMVPVRAIFEKLGATIDWDAKTKTATAVKGTTVVKLTVNSPIMTVSGKEVVLDSPATIIDSRTLVPLRAVSSAFGCKVGWVGKDRLVSLVYDARKSTMMYSKDGSMSVDPKLTCLYSELGWFLNEAMTETKAHTVKNNACSSCGKIIFELTAAEIENSNKAKWIQHDYSYNPDNNRIFVHFAFTEESLPNNRESLAVPVKVTATITDSTSKVVYSDEFLVVTKDYTQHDSNTGINFKKEYKVIIDLNDVATSADGTGTLTLNVQNPYLSHNIVEKISAGLPKAQKLAIPKLPLTVSSTVAGSTMTCTITDIQYVYGNRTLTVVVKGKKVAETPANTAMGCTLLFELFNSDSYRVDKSSSSSADVNVGGNFTITHTIENIGIQANQDYRIEIKGIQ